MKKVKELALLVAMSASVLSCTTGTQTPGTVGTGDRRSDETAIRQSTAGNEEANKHDAAGVGAIGTDPRVRAALSVVQVWLEAQRAYDQIPGLSVSLVYDQQTLWSGGFGYADLSRKRPASAQTAYSICSISKLFTSIAAMQLRDAGKLRLDDPVAKHLSWFAINRTQAGPEITIEGLLTHASGLPREAPYAYWTDATFPTHEEIVNGLRTQETLYPAEKYFQYSNLGLTLVGEVIAAASGVAYADFVQRNILQPLKLTHTWTELPESERGKLLASGYSAITRMGERKPTPFFQTRGIAPAAGYASTVEDLSRFAQWQFRLLDRGGSEVLNASTLREMYRVHFVDFSEPDFTEPDNPTTWGLGFQVTRSGGKTFVGHGGSCPGFQSYLLMGPEDKIATIFMMNAQTAGFAAWRYAKVLYEIVAPAIRAARKEPEKAKQPDPNLDRYIGSYEGLPFFGGELAIVRWEDGLGLLELPTMDPVKALIRLKKTGEHRFRRIRKDESLGEEMLFELGRDGKVSRISWNSNYFRRLGGLN
jgi:CubicO group peptidase (beta-lactamase class C family)